MTSESRREEDNESFLYEAIGLAVAILAIKGTEVASPHVREWWKGAIRPAIGRQKLRIRNFRRKNKQLSVEGIESLNDPQIDGDVELCQIMSQEETMSRLIAAMAAQTFSDEQLRMVHSARITRSEQIGRNRTCLCRTAG